MPTKIERNWEQRNHGFYYLKIKGWISSQFIYFYNSYYIVRYNRKFVKLDPGKVEIFGECDRWN